MAECLELLENLDPSCEALNKVGGVDKRFWGVPKNQIASYTTNSDGAVNTLLLKQIAGSSPAEYFTLAKFSGKRDKHDFGVEGVAGENVNTFNHQGIVALFAYSPAEIAAIEKLFNTDDVVLFAETNAGQIKVYGLDKGLNGSALSMREGVVLNDPTQCTVTLEGEQMTMPKVFSTGTLAQTIAYLDAKDGSIA
jgi:hypothetical protein